MPFDSKFKQELELDAPRAGEPKPLVIVVDDDDGIRSSLALSLRNEYRVQTYAKGAGGVQAVSDDTSAVILDIKMAEMDGFATYRRIRERDEDLPIIFHSAYQDLKDPYELMNEFRPFGYVIKGGDPMFLEDMLRAAVRHRARWMRYRRLMGEMQQIQAHMQNLSKRSGAT